MKKMKVKKCFIWQAILNLKEFIKQNENNIINYKNIFIYGIELNMNFFEELNNINQLTVKINQIVPPYNFIFDDINPECFEDDKNKLKKEKK